MTHPRHRLGSAAVATAVVTTALSCSGDEADTAAAPDSKALAERSAPLSLSR